jgi:hypothetical protein
MNFVPPVMSPGGVKMDRCLLTWEDRNNHLNKFESTSLHVADDISEFQQKHHFTPRKPLFYPLNSKNNNISIHSTRFARSGQVFRFSIADCKLPCAIQRISVISRLRLGTSSLRKTAWRCFFTIGKLKQASSAIS